MKWLDDMRVKKLANILDGEPNIIRNAMMRVEYDNMYKITDTPKREQAIMLISKRLKERGISHDINNPAIRDCIYDRIEETHSIESLSDNNSFDTKKNVY